MFFFPSSPICFPFVSDGTHFPSLSNCSQKVNPFYHPEMVEKSLIPGKKKSADWTEVLIATLCLISSQFVQKFIKDPSLKRPWGIAFVPPFRVHPPFHPEMDSLILAVS